MTLGHLQRSDGCTSDFAKNTVKILTVLLFVTFTYVYVIFRSSGLLFFLLSIFYNILGIFFPLLLI